MSCSILRFLPLSVIDPDEINNPEWYLKLYPSCIVSFTDSSTGIYLRSTQCGNNIIIQESNTINFTTRIDYVVVRYNNGTYNFTQWKIPGSNTLDFYSSNLVTINDKLRSIVSDGSITITPSGDQMILTTSGGGSVTGDFVEINELSNLNNTTTKKIKNLTVSGLELLSIDDSVLLSTGDCLINNDSNLIIPDTKTLKSLKSDDSSVIITSTDDYIDLKCNSTTTSGDFVELNDNSNLNNMTTKKIKNLEVSGLSLTNYDDKVLISSGSCLIDNGSNLIIPDTKMLNTLRVTETTKPASSGKIQLDKEGEYLTLNVGNCLSRYQQDGNLSNIQSGGYCRSLIFPDNEFTQNTAIGAQLRFYNNKLITNSKADTSEIVSNIICRDSNSVVQNELKNIIAGDNITLTSANETLTIGVTSMSGADFGLFKWTSFTKQSTPGSENLNDFYGFNISNNQYIYLNTGYNKITFEIENDQQDYDSGIPTKTCIFDLTKSTKSAYIYWAGKFPATWLKVGCVYSLIYTPSTGFIKLTMLNDNNDTHAQIIDTPSTPFLILRELHNRDTYRYNCFAGELNTLFLLTYDDVISSGCSIDIFGMNMSTSGTVLKVVLCNSDGIEFNVDDAKKINHKFTNDPHVSRNVGFNPWWDGSTNKELSFYLQSDSLEYMNVLHLDISNGNYLVWY